MGSGYIVRGFPVSSHMPGIKGVWLTEKNKMLLGNVSLCAKCYLLKPNKWMSEGKICSWMKSL